MRTWLTVPLFVTLLVGCAPPMTGTADTNSVTISGFQFGPRDIIVKAGTTVTWTNTDAAAHTVTARDGSFDSGALATGKTFSHTFDRAGTFAYSCTFHPEMTGAVHVTAP